MMSARSCGVPPVVSKPSVWKRSRIAGSFTILLVSALMRSTIAFGVCAGAKMPNQFELSKPGTPDSSMVGMSGTISERLADEIAMPLRRPLSTCGLAVITLSNSRPTWPEAMSPIDCCVPL